MSSEKSSSMLKAIGIIALTLFCVIPTCLWWDKPHRHGGTFGMKMVSKAVVYGLIFVAVGGVGYLLSRGAGDEEGGDGDDIDPPSVT